ncbi:hypothetical protein [Streptomyces cucumeris]|uniref:hypothetical protein n=1 Tax=Streptomyces cucumeris TaxID=2962890 RepID=UPI0020C8A08D|nr:hypothetical protein [Streptomyces sp. NEAU-Y11]MCP9208528.1 hypothetical protein [Streptomyces sp. NEAU-Y11]
MSQPPPPPNQPPQGGFGAPQDPGYGYPQQPPAPPQQGPGAPQAPGQPPQGPPPPPPVTPPAAPQTPPQGAGGYGYPGQPVHAQPTQVGMPSPFPSGQQQYGYPQQGQYPPQGQYQYPGAPAPGPGGGGSNQSKQRMMIIVAAVVAVALVIGGGIWFATKDKGGSEAKDDDKKSSQGSSSGNDGGSSGGFKKKPAPETASGKLLHKIPMPKVKDQVTVYGSWVTDDVYAKVGVYKIAGYPLDGGSPKWEIPLSGEICWASAHVTEDGLTSVVYKDAKPSKERKYGGDCTQVGLVDLKQGKLRWHKQLDGDYSKMRFDEVTIGGGTVAAGGSRGGAAWSLDGKQLWKPKEDDECRDNGYAGGGDKLVAVRKCGDYGNEQITVQTLNPKSGAVKSSYKVSRGLDYVHIASTDPLVIGLDAGDDTGSSVSDFLTIDDSGKAGKVVSKTSTENGKYEPKCESTNVEGCKRIGISKATNSLFMATEDRSFSSEGPRNEIVAFSLKTGKPIGKTEGVTAATLTPLGTDKDGYVLAYQDGGYSRGGAVWRIDPKSYEKSKLLQNDSSTAEVESDFSAEYSEVLSDGKRLFMADRYASKPSGQYDKDDPLAVIFGAS